MLQRERHGKAMLLAAALGGFLLIGVAAPVRADRDDKCATRIHKAEANLEKEIRRHGEHSRQAEKRRRQLREAREECRDHRHHNRDRDRDHDRDRY